jgi:hypothetical protein
MRAFKLCRYCGCDIPKVTTAHHFRYGGEGGKPVNAIPVDREVTDRAELARYTNEEIVSVRYTDHGDRFGRRIDTFSTWDGSSFVDPFFCKGEHAKLFGYALAREGRVMAEYNEALRKRLDAIT